MLYAIWNTIFINRFSIERYKIPIEIIDVELQEETIELVDKGCKDVDFMTIYSPRKCNSNYFYLCCDNVVWIYTLEHFHFIEELSFFKNYGLKVGRDIITLNVKYSKNSIDNCDWLKIVNKYYGNYWKVKVIQKNLYKGFQMRTIKK